MARNRKSQIIHDEIVRLFAARLRELRRERGVTQSELAQRAGVTETYISRLEGARAAPGIDLVDRLAKGLGVGAAELVPSTPPEDSMASFRDQASQLFGTLVKTADRETFALLNPILALLVEASSKRD